MTAIRPMRPDERAFVISGWSTSVRDSHDVALVPMRSWAVTMHPIFNDYIDRANVLVYQGDERVAVYRDGRMLEVDQLLGFIAYLPKPYMFRHRRLDGYVLFAYVPLPFRRRGIASALFAAAGFTRASAIGYAVGTRALWELRGGEDHIDRLPNVHSDPLRARFLGHLRRPDHDERDLWATTNTGESDGQRD